VRNLFLLLVLLNLGLFAVARWVVPEPPAGRYEGPSITLSSEVDPQGTIPAASDEAASAQDGNRDPETERCVAIGPFIEPADTDAAMAKLVDAGFEPSVLDAEGEVWDGYWVYLEQIESTQVARQMLSALSDAGVEDAYIIPNSDSGILISLGVYSDISRAGAQAERVGRLGYEATITDRHKTAQTQWLEITLRGETSAALDLLAAPGQISRLEQRACQSAEVVAE
jgi:hypothetical protein